MFYYLSFLRPPPLSGPLTGPISITPQIANDLRTESLDKAQDIYYSWSSPQDDTGPSKSSPPAITKPLKLTTWRQSSAYKELLVPLPLGVRNGQSWRLVLTSHVHGRPHVISLKDNDLGHTPFPVMSMPIMFNSRHPKTSVTGKQEQIERIYGFSSKSKEDNVCLIVREQTSYDLDKVK
jgi:protein N-lysine methyltransferase METTL21D